MLAIDQLTIHSGEFSLEAISLQLEKGRTLSVMGPSGSGKTTLMEALAGLRPIDEGSIHLAGREITHLPPRTRGIAIVPQDNALFPHLNVLENISFGICKRQHKRDEILDIVEQLAQQLNIEKLLKRNIQKLSGGEAKRVAIGRALAAKPMLLCLDEAFSGLDSENYEESLNLVQNVIATNALTTIHVTHSLKEAQRLGDMIFKLTTRSLEKA
ncbi:ATP-binding cassette domain-containing protein [Rubritalea marina]|uniref:ATP-binding cassette domain-containing protein n=1 Tax=Rubritalea marina TaxID=361055 RepID=UPI0003605045|nr:ATP-binding cassette domain-containing protein [Rubritalea marina]